MFANICWSQCFWPRIPHSFYHVPQSVLSHRSLGRLRLKQIGDEKKKGRREKEEKMFSCILKSIA